MGYSLLVSFRPKGPGPLRSGAPVEGSVPTFAPEHLGFLNMPPYPFERKAQINSFRLPGTEERVVLSLDLLEEPYRKEGRWRFTLPKDYRAIVSFRRRDFRLRQGERCDLGGGGDPGDQGDEAVDGLRRLL